MFARRRFADGSAARGRPGKEGRMHAFRVLALIGAAALVGLAPAHADESDLPERTPRHVLRARAYVKRGRQELERADKQETRTSELLVRDRALVFLRRARTFAEVGKHPELRKLDDEARGLLVTGLSKQARVYLARKSLPLAGKRVKEALLLDPKDATALELMRAVDAAEDGHDHYTSLEESNVEQRTRMRRYRSAVPMTGRAAGRSE